MSEILGYLMLAGAAALGCVHVVIDLRRYSPSQTGDAMPEDIEEIQPPTSAEPAAEEQPVTDQGDGSISTGGSARAENVMNERGGMKVYIAAPYPWRDSAILQMQKIEAAGFEVTSSWLRSPDVENDAFARLDLTDVGRADVLVAINPPEFERSGTGGRHVELGYAIATKKRIVLVGNPSNIFHHLNDIVRVASCDLIVDALRTLPAPLASPAVDAAAAIISEFYRAEAKHKPMNSHHEGYAVIAEELDELWDDVKRDRKPEALREAVQVGAMAMRFIADLGGRP